MQAEYGSVEAMQQHPAAFSATAGNKKREGIEKRLPFFYYGATNYSTIICPFDTLGAAVGFCCGVSCVAV